MASAAKSAYVDAKHGVVGLTKVTALETAGMGITANAICPGWVRTPLVEKQITALAAKDGVDQESAARELLGEKQPSLQFVTPEQLAARPCSWPRRPRPRSPAPPFPSTAAGQPASLVQIQGNLMLFLLSPAKKLDYDSPVHVETHTQPLFVDQAAALIKVLKTKSADEIAELMSLSPALAELNAGRYGAWKRSFTQATRARPSWRSNGDVYEGL